MIFTLSKKKLITALSIVSKVLPKKIILIERTHILVKVTEKEALISGTNNDLKSVIKIPVTTDITEEKEYLFTADPKILIKLLTKIDLEEITLEYDEKELQLKVYTSENKESYNTLQSFPTEKILKVKDIYNTDSEEYNLKTDIFKKAINFSKNYLEMKEDNKQYDFVILNKGVLYAANGQNRMGFFLTTDFKPIENLKIRKIAVPIINFILGKIDEEKIIIFENEKNIVFCTSDKNIYFGFLKSAIDPPKIPLDRVKKDGPYITIKRSELEKKFKRILSTKKSSSGSGIKICLKGSGTDSKLELNLLSKLKAHEMIPCERNNDDSPDDIEHIIDCKLFGDIISSFTAEKINIYLYKKSPFFRLYSAIKEDKNKYIMVGLGSYSRIVKK